MRKRGYGPERGTGTARKQPANCYSLDLRQSAPPPDSTTGLPAYAGAIEGLELVRVEGPELRLVFNELMASEHPRSARLHVGRQLRYLVGSSHGWLGGLLFAPATRVLAARDAWLGWDDASRERHLEEMIGLARFLIRPSVSVRYLASRVLGMAARRVVEDFAAVYGIRPLLAETCRATIKIRSAELTGAGESVQVRREGKANHHFHREPCVFTREGAHEASVAVRVARMIEHRKRYDPECRGFLIDRRQHLQDRHGEGLPGSALSEESRDARTPHAGTREGFSSPWQSCRGRGRKEIL